MLGVVLLSQSLNYFIVGPLTSKLHPFSLIIGKYLVIIVDNRTMFQRQKLEKEEGKVYSDPGVSKAFLILHYISCFDSYTTNTRFRLTSEL